LGRPVESFGDDRRVFCSDTESDLGAAIAEHSVSDLLVGLRDELMRERQPQLSLAALSGC
jgi:hypothetical protein